jgi:hypothetical protein
MKTLFTGLGLVLSICILGPTSAQEAPMTQMLEVDIPVVQLQPDPGCQYLADERAGIVLSRRTSTGECVTAEATAMIGEEEYRLSIACSVLEPEIVSAVPPAPPVGQSMVAALHGSCVIDLYQVIELAGRYEVYLPAGYLVTEDSGYIRLVQSIPVFADEMLVVQDGQIIAYGGPWFGRLEQMASIYASFEDRHPDNDFDLGGRLQAVLDAFINMLPDMCAETTEIIAGHIQVKGDEFGLAALVGMQADPAIGAGAFEVGLHTTCH